MWCVTLRVVSVTDISSIPSDVAILRVQCKFMNIYNVIVIKCFILNVSSHMSIKKVIQSKMNQYYLDFVVNRL